MPKDILILGGGPSGLSTALHLAQLAPELAARTLVLEKARYPRHKLCAGGLVADAEVILRRLGLDVSEVPHVDADMLHFDYAGRGLNYSERSSHTLRIIRRDEFDAWLAKNAGDRGIEIREGVTVKNVTRTDEGVIVETDQGNFHGTAVVGADGSNGVTRRCVLPDAPVNTARVLEVLTAFDGGTTPLGAHKPSNAYFDFLPVPEGIAGYTWDFPTQLNGQRMRCWGIYDTNILSRMERPGLKEPLSQEMQRYGFDLGECELKGYPIRWFDPFSPLSVPRVLLVGDAAGADPFFGEGISMALGYGRLAAEAIQDGFAKGDLSFSGYRLRLLASPLGQTLLVRWAMTQLLYHLHWTWFQRGFWRRMGWLIAPAARRWVLNWGKRMQ